MGGPAGEHPFLMMVSAGLDASVLAALDTRLKWRFGKAAIVWQGLREWWRYPYPRFEVIADGEPLEASFVAVSNIPYYGGAFPLAPGARPDDGKLDLVLFRGRGRRATLGFALDLLRGAHVRRRDVTVRHVEEVAPAAARRGPWPRSTATSARSGCRSPSGSPRSRCASYPRRWGGRRVERARIVP